MKQIITIVIETELPKYEIDAYHSSEEQERLEIIEELKEDIKQIFIREGIAEESFKTLKIEYK